MSVHVSCWDYKLECEWNFTEHRKPTKYHYPQREPPNDCIHTLTIAAFSQYNATAVQCLILYLDGTGSQSSPSANLWIQGLTLFCGYILAV